MIAALQKTYYLEGGGKETKGILKNTNEPLFFVGLCKRKGTIKNGSKDSFLVYQFNPDFQNGVGLFTFFGANFKLAQIYKNLNPIKKKSGKKKSMIISYLKKKRNEKFFFIFLKIFKCKILQKNKR